MSESGRGSVPDEWAASHLDLGAYLRRIGASSLLLPDGPTLARLHRGHVLAIPFENADIMLGRGVAVDLASIQDKLVYRRRGGYCFEHGLLLAAVLERLGYRVDRLLARVGGEQNARTHLALRVHAGQECWLADTGFGTGLLEPLPFDDGTPHPQHGWTYRLLAASKHSWQLQERQGRHWATLYRFDDQPQHASDILVANHFTSTYPGSHFVRQLVVIRKDAAALHLLTGRRLTITRQGHPGDERHLSDSEFADALTKTFGLQLSTEEITRLTSTTRNSVSAT